MNPNESPENQPAQEQQPQPNSSVELPNVDGPNGLGDPVSSAAVDAINSAGEVVAGGCAEGCGGCSLAILITFFAVAGTALALFR